MKTCPLWAAGRWYWNIEHCSGKHSSIHSFIYSSIQPFIHSSIHFAVNHYLHKLSDALRCPWPQINCFLAYWCQAILISIQQSHFSSLLVTVITDWKYPTFFSFSGANAAARRLSFWFIFAFCLCCQGSSTIDQFRCMLKFIRGSEALGNKTREVYYLLLSLKMNFFIPP